jgi:hypothetical protein
MPRTLPSLMRSGTFTRQPCLRRGCDVVVRDQLDRQLLEVRLGRPSGGADGLEEQLGAAATALVERLADGREPDTSRM